MKRLFSYIFCLPLLAACAAEGLEHGSGAGYISVGLYVDQQTKAALLTDEEAGEYNISVLDSEGNPAVYQSPEDKKGQQIPVMKFKDFETVTVEVGKSYSVTAESCTVAESEVGTGSARYYGSSGSFELNASNIYQKADIVCSQTNALVTVIFDGSVTGRFTDLKVTLTSGSRTLTVGETVDEVPAYFTPALLSYVISGTYSETGYEVNIAGNPMTLEARDNIRLTVRLDLTHGQADVPSLTVTEEYSSDQDVDYEIDPYL